MDENELTRDLDQSKSRPSRRCLRVWGARYKACRAERLILEQVCTGICWSQPSNTPPDLLKSRCRLGMFHCPRPLSLKSMELGHENLLSVGHSFHLWFPVTLPPSVSATSAGVFPCKWLTVIENEWLTGCLQSPCNANLLNCRKKDMANVSLSYSKRSQTKVSCVPSTCAFFAVFWPRLASSLAVSKRPPTA